MDKPYTPLTRRLLTKSEALALALLLGFPLLADQLMTGAYPEDDMSAASYAAHGDQNHRELASETLAPGTLASETLAPEALAVD